MSHRGLVENIQGLEDATRKRCPVFAPEAFSLEVYLMAEIGDDGDDELA